MRGTDGRRVACIGMVTALQMLSSEAWCTGEHSNAAGEAVKQIHKFIGASLYLVAHRRHMVPRSAGGICDFGRLGGHWTNSSKSTGNGDLQWQVFERSCQLQTKLLHEAEGSEVDTSPKLCGAGLAIQTVYQGILPCTS